MYSIMTHQPLVQAETEFQQGNFDVAASLYSEAIETFDHVDGDSKEFATLLQKLADSEYAQNKFDAAREVYSRLATQQEAQNFAAKDRVSALLKLAKCADKCEAYEEASNSYKTAYELLNSLSAKHFLRKTVIDSYAEYLRVRGEEPELLDKLEDELGIKKSAAEEEKPAVEEVTPDSITTPMVARKPVGEEFKVLKTRLGKFSRKKETDSEQPEEKGPSVLEKRADKTVEQEVAERKFLRKGDGTRDKSQERTSRRSSLRNVMSQERGSRPGPESDGQTNEPDIADNQLAPVARSGGEFDASPGDRNLPAVIEPSSAVSEIDQRSTVDDSAYPAVRDIDPTSLDQSMYPSAAASNLDADMVRGQEEYVYQMKDLAKFVGRRPKRTLRESAHTGMSEIAAPSLVVEAVSMPEATRTFLQQADAIKKSSDVAEPAPDVVPLRVEGRVETVVPTSQKVVSNLKLISPIIGLVVMLAAGIFLLIGLAPKQRPGGALPAFVMELVGRKFITADGALAFTVGKKQAEFEGDLSGSKKYRYWTGEWTDEIALLQGAYSNCRWMIIKPEGLKDANGGTFYALDAPERKTVKFCKTVSELAQNYFAENKKFPGFNADLGEAGTYSNPYTGKGSPVQISSTVDNKRAVSTPNSPLDLQYQSGEPFKQEAAGAPGEVHALSISGQPVFSEAENTYTWATQCFYVHGFDRNGKLIDGSGPQECYLLTDKNGTVLSHNSQQLRTAYGDSELCFVQTEKPKSDAIMMKYLMILFGIIALMGFVFFQFWKSKYRFR